MSKIWPAVLAKYVGRPCKLYIPNGRGKYQFWAEGELRFALGIGFFAFSDDLARDRGESYLGEPVENGDRIEIGNELDNRYRTKREVHIPEWTDFSSLNSLPGSARSRT
jgi:hypothetical protein